VSIIVVAVLESNALGMRETIEFLVDTGASRTTIWRSLVFCHVLVETRNLFDQEDGLM